MTARLRIALAAAALALLPSRPAAAQQVDWHVALGATYATPLVEDRIYEDVEVRQSVAPTLLAGAALPVGPRYRVGLEAAFATGGFDAESGGGSTDLGTLRTLAVTVGVNGPILGRLRWRAGVGVLVYLPAEDAGIFRRGSPTPLAAGVGAEYRLPRRGGWDFVALARYDLHRFTTDELEARGFPRSREVHRVALGVGLMRAPR